MNKEFSSLFVNLTGQKFGRLLVLRFNGRDKKKNYTWEWEV